MKISNLLFLIILPLFCSILLLSPFCEAIGANKTTLYLFWGKGCPHCKEEEAFLTKLKKKYPQLEVKDYEIWYNKKNADFFAAVMKAAKAESAAVPATLINGRLFIGFSKQIAKDIEDAVKNCVEQGCADALEVMRKKSLITGSQEEQSVITLPVFGKLDPSKVSLPLFTIIIGGMDSFNPCAFFVLMFLLSLLIHAGSRKKMLAIGGIFVFFSGLVYFLFMAAWLNIFLIIGQIRMITAAAGIIALTIASINIKDYFFFKKGVSLIIPKRAKPKIFERMRGLLNTNSSSAMLMGTITLAITVNMYELLCTAGFPMVYTRALTLHKLTSIQYYMYLILYNTVYIIPLLVIVIIITATLGARKLTELHGRRLKLLSGIMMLFLGAALLLNPGFLNNLPATVGLFIAALSAAGIIIFLTRKSIKE